MIRPAASADADAIAFLLGALGYPVDAAAVPGRLSHLRADGRSEIYVAVQAGGVVGLATAHVKASLTRGEDIAQLTTLVVADTHRGQGIGAALVRAVEAYGRRAGCRRIVVTTANHRDDAHAFYDRLGWEWTGRRYAKMIADVSGDVTEER